MAKRKTGALQAPAVVMLDVVDLITGKLNELEGIEFARDAWENKAPDQYGVVTLALEPIVQYADGHLIDEINRCTVDMYTEGSSDTWPALVREKLAELEDVNDWLDLSCRLTAREYLFDINKVHWTMQINFAGPVIRTVSAGG